MKVLIYECEIYVHEKSMKFIDFLKNMKKDFPYLSQVTKRTICGLFGTSTSCVVSLALVKFFFG